jgi:PAS domain S-box-containing protein
VDIAQATRRRGVILEAVAFAAERLLLSTRWQDATADVLEHLGEAAGVSRAYVLQNHIDDLGTDRVTQRAEWCAPGIASQRENPTLTASAWNETGFDRWPASMKARAAIAGPVGTFPEREQAELALQDVVSMCVVPVFVSDSWWGCVGFDECIDAAREWTTDEVEALRAAAGVLGAAIERQAADARRRETERRYRAFIETIPAVTYTDIPNEGGSSKMGFVSPQIESLLGYPPERFMDDPELWFSLMHPDDFARLKAKNAFDTADTTPFDEEYRMRTAGGRWIWVHDTSTAVVGPDGTIDYFLGFMEDVSARKTAELQARKAQEDLHLLFSHIPAIAYHEPPTPEGEEYDARAAEWFVSPQAEMLLGYTAEQMSAPSFWSEVAHPDDIEAVLEESKRTAKTGDPFRCEYRMIAKDGREVWFLDESVLAYDEHGKPLGWHGILVDISDRVAAEEKVREAEERFRTIVEQNPAVIYTQEFDPTQPSVSRTTYISPRQTELLGYTSEDVEAAPELWTRQIHPDDRERVLAADVASNASRASSFSLEYRLIAKDGRIVWVHDQAELMQGGDGNPFWQGFLVDITERKLAEQAVQESNERLNLVIDTALDAVITMNAAGIIIGWNPQAETTFGWSRGEAIGRTLADTIIPASMRAAHEDGLRRYLRTGEGPVLNARIEVTALHRDGHEFPVELAISPVKLGEELTFSGFVRDITERKVAERELERSLELEREATHRLRALDEMKNTFLQAVSHDLRTPLSAILGLAITLERSDRLQLAPADARDLAGRIAGNARRLERLVINLLDMDRLARGIVEPTIEPTNIGAVVRRLLDETGLISADRLRTSLPEIVVPVDPAKLERIIENLLANTARHAPADATVWVSLQPEDGGVVLAVEDDGPGVEPELREAIFEPFHQGSDIARHSPGVGVGLALVLRFAELHGGRAWVQERPGGGASFRVWLPADELSTEEPASEAV